MSDAIASSKGGRKSRWRWVGLAVVAIAAVLFVLWSAWDREAMMAWKREAGPLPFFAVMAILPAFGVPLTPFFILAGATFGGRLGLLGSGIALGLNLAVCYWIASSGMRSRLEALLRRFSYELPDLSEMNKGAVRFTLMVKLAPGVPASIKNYGLGVAGVPFPLYFGVSMLISGSYGASLVVLGESLLEHDLRRAVLAAAVVAVVAVGLWWWRKRRGHR